MTYTPPYPGLMNKTVAVEGTLVASTVATVDVNVSTITCVEIEVLNRTGSAEIQYTIGTSAVPPSDPTSTNSDMLPASVSSKTVPNNHTATIRVKLLSVGTPDYKVIARGY